MTTISPMTALEAEVAELATEYAPRRFALCWVDAEQDDGGILYWGLQFRDGGATLIDDSGRRLGDFESAESARRLFSRTGAVTLVWLDPPDAPTEGVPRSPARSVVRRH
jgi:hypothetical protein